MHRNHVVAGRHPSEIKEKYGKLLDRHITTMRELAFRKNISYAFTGTDKHYLELFRGLAK